MHYRLIAAIIFISTFSNCSSSKLYRTGKYFKGSLNDSDYVKLREYLHVKTDTIVLKYDFNRETCWDNLDRADDSYIRTVVKNYQSLIDSISKLRPQISIYQYREPGSQINKFKKWNEQIKIDNGLLRKMIFTEKTVCGTSAVILPDKNYILIKSDSHFEAVLLTKDVLSVLLK